MYMRRENAGVVRISTAILSFYFCNRAVRFFSQYEGRLSSHAGENYIYC